MTSAFGVRDKAMLELLYATGLLCFRINCIKFRRCTFNDGVCSMHRKGNKERIIPLGSLATEAIQKYIEKEEEN